MRPSIFDILDNLNQNHVYEYFLTLPEVSQKKVISQLESLDLSVLSNNFCDRLKGRIEPPNVLTIDTILKKRTLFYDIGSKVILEGRIGVVLLAGGQGSRLGFNHPKGMFNIGVTKKLYIFECLINNLLQIQKQFLCWVPLFIMVSEDNSKETKEFLEQYNYFGYNKDKIFFFTQEQLPITTIDGKLVLFESGEIVTTPNGNGGWFSSMVKSGVLEIANNKHIEWLNVVSVDNVLQKMADPYFIGAVIESKKSSGAKVVEKAFDGEKIGIICKEDEKPSIVEYYELTDDLRYSKNKDGKFLYNYGVILNYLFNVKDLIRNICTRLPIHRSIKKLNYTNDYKIINLLKNSDVYKFETLALDLVKMQNDCLAYEVDRTTEFAPVKNKEGVDSVQTARELLRRNNLSI